jgi:hypothetical protein
MSLVYDMIYPMSPTSTTGCKYEPTSPSPLDPIPVSEHIRPIPRVMTSVLFKKQRFQYVVQKPRPFTFQPPVPRPLGRKKPALHRARRLVSDLLAYRWLKRSGVWNRSDRLTRDWRWVVIMNRRREDIRYAHQDTSEQITYVPCVMDYFTPNYSFG